MLITPIKHIEIIAPGEGVDVWLRPSPFRLERRHFVAPAGSSIEEIIDLCRSLHVLRPAQALHVSIDGHAVPRQNWRRIRVKSGVSLNILAVPGQNAIRSILSVVVAVAALFLAPILAAPIISTFGLTGLAATAVTGMVAGGITVAGSLAVNALFPKAASTTSSASVSDDTKTLYSIGGAQNETSQYGAIPVIFGTHRTSPRKAAGDYTEILGDDQYLRLLFCVGYGPIDVSDVKIGETPISKFDGVSIEIIADHTVQSPTLYTEPVYEEAVSILLQSTDGWTTRTTVDDVEWISVDLSFPNGVYRYQKSDGARVNYTVQVTVQYAPANTTGWVTAGVVTVDASSPQAVRRALGWAVAKGQYDVRVIKSSADYSGSDTVSEAVFWSALRGRRNVNAVTFDKPLTLIALRIKASNELSGTINNLNLIAQPRIKAWNGSDWFDDQHSKNPADHFRYVLQGSPNARPVADSQIDLQSLQDWHAYCDDQGFTFNYEAREAKSVYDTLTMIAAAGRAAVSWRDGRWGVVWDVASSPIVQHFSPRNSWGFQSTRAYADLPHGFRVSFINEDNGYLNDERVVYDDGYTAANATKFEGLDFAGVTDPDLIWRHGRYHLAQLRLQREVYSLNADFEHLVCTRGDRVRVNHDVVLWGAGSGRVKSVSTSPQGVTIDDTFTMEAGKTYAARFRRPNGASLLRTITGVAGDFSSFVFADSGDLPEVGDLVLFGEQSFESVVLRVKSITGQADLTAKLELVDDAPGILDADTGEIPAFQTGIASLIDYRSYTPTDLTYQEDVWTTSPATSVLDLAWVAPSVGSVSSYILQFASAGTGNWSPAISTAVPSAQLTGLTSGTYDIRLRAIFANGQLSGWLNSSVFANIFQRNPDDVSGFRIAVTGDAALLQWDALADASVAFYQIRFSPEVSGVTWETATILRSNLTSNTAQIATIKGTYLIKAVSFSGLASVNATSVVSTIDGLTSFNAVAVVTDMAWAGVKDRVFASGGELRLDSAANFFAATDFFAPSDFFLQYLGYAPEGYYYLGDKVDLLDVYSCRLSAALRAYGELSSDDFFARSDFFEVANFFPDIAGDWDVSLLVSTTNDDPASGGAVWSSWADLVTGDVVGRGFRFALRLTSDRTDVTPVVQSVSIDVDMPDRILSGSDVVVGTGGLTISFTPPYKVLQGLSIAAQGLQTGDYYVITAKSNSGFSIVFKDASNAPVSRLLDYVAKGYGLLN